MKPRLADKVCIITGSGGSMGRAAALSFAAEGAWVVGCDLNEQMEAETRRLVMAAGGRMVSHRSCNLSDPAACAGLAEFAVAEFGTIDVLYNNAAGGRFAWVEQLTVEDWRATMVEELDLVFFMCQAAWPHLKRRGGSIVNCASMSGKIGVKCYPRSRMDQPKQPLSG